MESDLMFLLDDPRPDLAGDSRLWKQLFRLIPRLENREAARVLSPRLYYFRAYGTKIRWTIHATEFVPVIHETLGWASLEEYKEAKQKYLRPYADDIFKLLYKLV